MRAWHRYATRFKDATFFDFFSMKSEKRVMRIQLVNQTALIQWLGSGAMAAPGEAGLPPELASLFGSGRSLPTSDELARLEAGQPFTRTGTPGAPGEAGMLIR